jgi:SAM-dependent methyltransferase
MGLISLCSLDIAAVSVDQASKRWQDLRAPRFDANFAALDCYSDSLSKALPPARLAQPFDVVSMQFCMHYAFENVQKARCMLDNVSRWLRPGGVFIGTIPNADQLLYVLRSGPLFLHLLMGIGNVWTLCLPVRRIFLSVIRSTRFDLKIENKSLSLVTNTGSF